MVEEYDDYVSHISANEAGQQYNILNIRPPKRKDSGNFGSQDVIMYGIQTSVYMCEMMASACYSLLPRVPFPRIHRKSSVCHKI